MINLFRARMSPDAGAAVTEVLNSGFTGQGKKVDEFEQLLQKELGLATLPIAVNSCTSAIDIALELCGVGHGDWVISISATCFASNTNIINRKANIIWADIDPITSLIDPKSVEEIIKTYPERNIKAIVAVNWAGKFCDYKSLKSFGIPVIEDAAHTWDVFHHLGDYNQERGDYICYSFQSIKFLQTGDGGLLITPPEKENDARLYRWFGLDRTKGASFRCTQNIKTAGKKYNMIDINASIGIENVLEARESVYTHRDNSRLYINSVKNENYILPEWDESCSYWLFSMHVLNGRKQEFIEYLKDNGIESSPVHYRNDEYDCTKQFKDRELHGVDFFSDTQVCIPNGWWLTEYDIEHIINVLNNFK